MKDYTSVTHEYTPWKKEYPDMRYTKSPVLDLVEYHASITRDAILSRMVARHVRKTIEDEFRQIFMFGDWSYNKPMEMKPDDRKYMNGFISVYKANMT